MTSRKTERCTLLLALLLAAPAAARAADWDRHPILEDRWRVSLGSFFQTVASELAVSGSLSLDPAQRVDFNEAVGLSKDDTRFSGHLHWRFGEKWSLAVQYFDQKDSSTATLEETITWEGNELREGSNVSAGVSNEVYRVFFGRKFSEGPNHEFGAGLGVHWLEIGAFIEGEFFLNGESLGAERRNVSASAPLPNIGAWYAYAFTPRWAAHARADYFSASFDEYSGGLTNAAVGVQFQAWRNVAFGLDYNYFELDVDVDSGDWLGEADFVRDGPFVYATFTW